MAREATLIRLEHIRPTSRGQPDAFEMLVCQLAQQRRPERAQAFRRIHGAGGDGGVEGYWLMDDGTEQGYQAKYYLHSRDVDWEAIDDSVSQALKQHPRLKQYTIVLPCDLTDRGGTAGKGHTGWERWATHKAKWKEMARDLGLEVGFEAWTAFNLQGMLAEPSMSGLSAWWFGTLAVSAEQLAPVVRRAILDLDERYHPEDHVHVGVEDAFGILVRGEATRARLHALMLDVQTRSAVVTSESALLLAHYPKEVVQASDTLRQLAASQATIDAPAWDAWGSHRWRQLAQVGRGHVSILATKLREGARAGPNADRRAKNAALLERIGWPPQP